MSPIALARAARRHLASPTIAARAARVALPVLAALAMPASATAQSRGSSQPAAAPAAAAPPTGLAVGVRDSLRSTVLNELRRVLIWTPPSYRDTTFAPRRYPVLYLLDGDAHFHSVTGLLQILATGINGTYVLPEMIVVAIPNTNRMRDLSPTHVTTGYDGKPDPQMAASGGGAAFLRFLTTELIPHVDSAYRTTTHRTLVGHSLGGLMAIQAMYTVPGAFTNYLAIDPSLWWDKSLTRREAAARLAPAGALAGKGLYVAQANTMIPTDTVPNQHFNDIAQFDAIARRATASGLHYGFRYYPEDSHGSVPLIAEYDGLRFLYEGYALDLMRVIAEPAYLEGHYAEVGRRHGVDPVPPESVVDLLVTYASLLEAGKPQQLPLARLATRLYPASAHAHERLARLMRAAGDTTGAIAELTKAVELAPGRAALKTTLDGWRPKR